MLSYIVINIRYEFHKILIPIINFYYDNDPTVILFIAGINEEYRILQVIQHVQALLLIQISVSLEGEAFNDTCEETRSLHVFFGNISNNYMQEVIFH